MDEDTLVLTLLFGSKVCAATTAEDRRRIIMIEMKSLRAVCGVSTMNRARSDEKYRCGSVASIGNE